MVKMELIYIAERLKLVNLMKSCSRKQLKTSRQYESCPCCNWWQPRGYILFGKHWSDLSPVNFYDTLWWHPECSWAAWDSI